MCVAADVCLEVHRLPPPALDPCFAGDLETGLALVDAVVRQVEASIGAVLPREDMVSLGRRGLLDAMSRFDPTRGASFRTFVSRRVRGAIIDGMRTEALMPRRAFAHLEGEAPHGAVRSDEDDRDDSVGDDPDRATSPEDAVMRAELLGAVLGQLDRLPPLEAELVRRHYLQEKPIEQAARDLGLSASWASRLLAQAMDTLRFRMTQPQAASTGTTPSSPAPQDAGTASAPVPVARPRRRARRIPALSIRPSRRRGWISNVAPRIRRSPVASTTRVGEEAAVTARAAPKRHPRRRNSIIERSSVVSIDRRTPTLTIAVSRRLIRRRCYAPPTFGSSGLDVASLSCSGSAASSASSFRSRSPPYSRAARPTRCAA